MNWYGIIEPALKDTFIVDETTSQYASIMDSLKFEVNYLEGLKCSQVNIVIDREKDADEGGTEYIMENNQLEVWIESAEKINLMINVSNICIKEFDESCTDSY